MPLMFVVFSWSLRVFFVELSWNAVVMKEWNEKKVWAGDLGDERTFLEQDKNGKDRNGCSVSRELKHSVYVTLQDQR